MAGLAALCIASQDYCSAKPANTVISSLDNSGSAIVNDNVSCTFGYSLTLGGSDASVTQLGVWDQGNDGLAEAHSVGLWTSTGTLLASAIVPSGTSASLYNGFRYMNIAPLNLSAGTTYVLGVYDDALNTDEITFQQTVTLGSDIASIGAPLLLDGIDLAYGKEGGDDGVSMPCCRCRLFPNLPRWRSPAWAVWAACCCSAAGSNFPNLHLSRHGQTVAAVLFSGIVALARSSLPSRTLPGAPFPFK